jgi:hypothetical protein
VRAKHTSTKSGFRHKSSKKISPGPKNGQERHPLRFSTICAKNQVLKLNINKVTTILRLNSPYWRPSPVVFPFYRDQHLTRSDHGSRGLKNAICPRTSFETSISYYWSSRRCRAHGRARVGAELSAIPTRCGATSRLTNFLKILPFPIENSGDQPEICRDKNALRPNTDLFNNIMNSGNGLIRSDS